MVDAGTPPGKDPSSSDNELSASRRGWIPARGFFAVIGYGIVSLIAIAGLIELGAYIVLRLRHGPEFDRVDPIVSSLRRSPVYAGVPWGSGYLAEEQKRWQSHGGHYVPFRIWGAAPAHGQYVNTDDAATGPQRRTVNPLSDSCRDRKPVEIWVFGGSTMYGTGAPDWATIPSYLSAKLNARSGACVKLTNLGAEGYVTYQELMLLIEKLKDGDRPQHVIFYDGVNESRVGTLAPGVPTAHASLDVITARVENTTRNQLDFLFRSYSVRLMKNLLQRWDRKKPPAAGWQAVLAERTEATMANYEANLRIIRLLADAYHFKAHFFWQPCLYFGKTQLHPFEREISDKEVASGSGVPAAMRAVWAAAQRRASPDSFVFLGGVLEGVEDPIYLDDWMHLSPRGNELVADAIAATLDLGP